jgi:hypothetical protein
VLTYLGSTSKRNGARVLSSSHAIQVSCQLLGVVQVVQGSRATAAAAVRTVTSTLHHVCDVNSLLTSARFKDQWQEARHIRTFYYIALCRGAVLC